MNARTGMALLIVALVSRPGGGARNEPGSSTASRRTTHVQGTAPSRTPEPASATLSDFSWMAGRWTGTVDGSPAEEICSQPTSGLIMCMFRVFDEHVNLELEFRTFKQTANEIEERVRFLSPDSGSVEPGEVFLMLQSFTARTAVFENPQGSRPKRETILRSGTDSMVERIEMVGGDGKSEVIEGHYTKRAP